MIRSDEYVERVYAGVLGKMIGVYLGRPFEGWPHERIAAELGEITTYVHDRLGKPLIVTDDDLTGTFTFPQALPDHDFPEVLTPQQVAESWLNYVIEKRTLFWWGGVGNSTEHTAYVRLRDGIPAPDSGSIRLNGPVVAQQIGAQIFIDGWGMIAPGDPERAAHLARCAASVSHDGEAIYSAQVIAVLESLAFVESALERLLDEAVRFIPPDSITYRLIHDLRAQSGGDADWHAALAYLRAQYWADRYPGACHIVPNHGIIIMSLLHAQDDFQRAMTIVNTAGFDTDCNAGNVGCLLGIKNGLAALNSGQDWRAPLADRLFKPTADSGAAISDAVRETLNLVNIARHYAHEPPLEPKSGARFHFDLPGAVQGFQVESSAAGRLRLSNVLGHSRAGRRSLALTAADLQTGSPLCASTATFILPGEEAMPGYELLASPTLYSGQTARAAWRADAHSAGALQTRLYIDCWSADDRLMRLYDHIHTLSGGQSVETSWRIPPTDSQPIARIGLEIASASASEGTIYLDYLTWSGAPDVLLTRPASGGSLWRRAWVDAVDHFDTNRAESIWISQDRGRGLLIQGTRDWHDYSAEARLRPYLARAFGVAVRVQGLRRWYGLLLIDGGQLALIKCEHSSETILAAAAYQWQVGQSYRLRLEIGGSYLRGWVDDQLQIEAVDPSGWTGGGAALLIEEGCLDSDGLAIRPLGH